jgi:pentatricopeptide repeat protein
MEADGICPDLITYTTLIKTYANASPARPEQAEEILALMSSKGMQPNVVSYTTVVTAYANARPPRVQDAERVVLKMEQNGVIANEVTYNSLMKAYASQKPAQPHKAEEILVRMERLGIRPDVISYSSLATSYGNAEKVDTVAAENVLTRMQEKGIVGNTITYSSVVAAFSNKSPSDPVGAERVIQKMIDNNIKCNTITYCNLICAYRNAGRAAEAACVLDRMAAAGVKADAVCYNAVIKAFSNLPLGKPGFLEAFAVAERMQNDGIVPNIVTANLLLESAARDQRASVLPAAQKLFNEIPTEARDKYTYPRMLHVLANFSRESEAFNLFHEARENLACWPNEFVFKAGIRACPSHRHELQQIWNQDARDPRFKEARVHVPQRNREGKHRRPITHPIKRE